MVYSDYYRVIMNITGSNNTKHYVEFAKAWLNDKDIDEGKMWYYYIYVMCDHIREAEMECYEEKCPSMKMKKKTLDIIVEVVDEWVCSEDVACMIRMIMKERLRKSRT